MEAGWKLIYSTIHQHRIVLAQEILESEGIESSEINHKDSAFTVIGEHELYVKDADADRAIELLTPLKKGEN